MIQTVTSDNEGVFNSTANFGDLFTNDVNISTISAISGMLRSVCFQNCFRFNKFFSVIKGATPNVDFSSEKYGDFNQIGSTPVSNLITTTNEIIVNI